MGNLIEENPRHACSQDFIAPKKCPKDQFQKLSSKNSQENTEKGDIWRILEFGTTKFEARLQEMIWIRSK